ncbi:MAG: hypothetical protein A2Y38_06020 [Spirochaetes bacterium GWB1_59_5]|nr:MAG: hypothetical protein A2Y38_06020 [Spirochaetes bacterium GWB1_59_5]
MSASFRIDTAPVAHRLKLLASLGGVPSQVAVALNEVAEETMLDSKAHTPVDTGRLRASGHVSQMATASSLRAELSYGTDYAKFVHEHLRTRHKVGEAKFLENAVNRTAGDMAARLAEKLRALRVAG